MTKREKQAFITYLEWQLEAFCKSIEKHIDSDAVGFMYDEAYNLRSDIDDLLTNAIIENMIINKTTIVKKLLNQKPKSE